MHIKIETNAARPVRAWALLSRARSLAVWLMMGSLLTACDLGGQSSIDLNGVVVPVGSDVASEQIGPAGGTVTSTDGMAALSVPPGALTQTQTVSIRTSEVDDDSVPDGLERGDDRLYLIDSGGQSFQAPVTLRIDSGQNAFESTGGPGGTGGDELSASLQCLTRFDGIDGDNEDSVSLLAGQRTEINADTGAVTLVADLPPDDRERIVNIAVAELQQRSIDVDIEGLVASVAVDADPVDVDVRVVGDGVFIDDVTFQDGSLAQISVLPVSGSLQRTSGDATDSTPSFRGEVGQDCLAAGSGQFILDLALQVRPGPSDETGLFPEAGIEKSVRLLRTINCTAPPTGGGEPPEPGGAVSLGSGVFPAPRGLTNPEVLYLIGPQIGNLPLPPGQRKQSKVAGPQLLATLTGAQGQLMFDLISGDVVREELDSEADANATGKFGQVPVSRPNPGPDSPAALFSFEQPAGSSPFGGRLTNYLPDEQSFGGFSQFLLGRFRDAVTAGGGLVSDEIVYASSRGIGFVQYSAESGLYDQADTTLTVSGRTFVSAYAQTAGGPVLAVTFATSNNQLYYMDRTSEAQLVERGMPGDVDFNVIGNDARRIRCEGALCAISLFADDALRLLLWDGQNAPTVIEPVVAVGDGPVGIDMLTLSDGAVGIASTGFGGNSVHWTVVETDGSVRSSTAYQAPAGCEAPAHITLVENVDDVEGAADNPHMVGTCFDSNNYFVTLLDELVAGGLMQ